MLYHYVSLLLIASPERCKMIQACVPEPPEDGGFWFRPEVLPHLKERHDIRLVLVHPLEPVLLRVPIEAPQSIKALQFENQSESTHNSDDHILKEEDTAVKLREAIWSREPRTSPASHSGRYQCQGRSGTRTGTLASRG